MKKLIVTLFAVGTLSASLIGCGRVDDTTSTTAAGAGVGLVAGGPVGAVVGAGIGALVGQRASERDLVTYRKRGVVYRDGYAYHIRNGRYVAVR